MLIGSSRLYSHELCGRFTWHRVHLPFFITISFKRLKSLGTLIRLIHHYFRRLNLLSDYIFKAQMNDFCISIDGALCESLVQTLVLRFYFSWD